jgi:nicotinamidase-related amidase
MIEFAGKQIPNTLAEIVEPSRTARNLSYDVVGLKDCVGSRNREAHEMALKLMEQAFFEVATAADSAAIWQPR